MREHDYHFTTPYGESETPRAVRERARRAYRETYGHAPQLPATVNAARLGARLAKLRRERKWSRRTLAFRSGMPHTLASVQTIAKYETGTSRPKWHRLCNLADVLATTPEYLMFGRLPRQRQSAPTPPFHP